MFVNTDSPIIPYYSPISSKGGKRKHRGTRRRTKKHRKSNKSRTRRYY